LGKCGDLLGTVGKFEAIVGGRGSLFLFFHQERKV
jgi:hypothetical protein